MLSPVSIDAFGGLDTRTDQADSGWGSAVSMSNVDLSTPGVIRSRDGARAFVTSLTDAINGMVATNYVLLATTTTPATFAYQNNTTYSRSPSGGGVSSAVDIDDGTYYAESGNSTIQHVESGTFTSPTATVDGVAGLAMPKPYHLAMTPTDFRLAAANCPLGGPNGASSSASHVHFSDPGDPTSWTSNSYVQLTPGDREDIVGMVVWRELLFVFKRTKFFVFYGTSTDSTGQPIFDYRTIDTGVGGDVVDDARGWLVTAARDGVYFCGRRGVYRTTGGEPVLVSPALDGVFLSGGTAWFTGNAPTQITSSGNMVICACSGATASDHVYVLFTDTGRWAVWDLGRFPVMFDYPSADDRTLYFVKTVSGTDEIWRVVPGDGCESSSVYQSGFHRPGGPGSETTIRETELIGSGKFTFAWGGIGGGSFPSSTFDTTAGSDSFYRLYHRKSAAGESLNFQISATEAWSISSIVPMIREVRGPGEDTP